MITLGVTGGIGSGKTTVCRLLEERGAEVFYADEVGKRILQDDPGARRELVEAFGERAYDLGGRLDRAYVASRVFGDEEAVARINAIVHPRVHAAFDRARRDAGARGVRVLVKEAALLLDSGGKGGLDAILVVSAPEADRVGRVAERDGSDPEDVRLRMAHQRSDASLREAADFVIENAGTPEDLEAQVDAVWRVLASRPRWPEVPPNLPRGGNAFTRWLGRAGLRLMRFRVVADLPDLKQFVVIGAPHTTNWDFVLSMLLLFALGLRIHWIGKHTIFRWPFGGLMRALGGIAVDRSEPGDLIDQVVARFRAEERFAVGLSPEGTRRRTERWKSGFYRIAVAARVPIVLGVIDFGRRELRLDSVFHPSGDFEADLPLIRRVYRAEQAKYPELFA
jgi:dephospho-CoA kinase